MIRPRKPFVALLLSVVPGLGQIYNGQLPKGLLLLLFDLLFPVLFGVSGVLLKMSGLMIMALVGVAFFIYRMVDAFIVAKRLKPYELKPFNKWYTYLVFTLCIFGIRYFLDAPTSTGILTLRVPTPSMVPTILPGDFVVAQLNAYDDRQINYGDIVIFNAPNGSIWTHRVVALPLDTLEIVEGKVLVNGQANETRKFSESVYGDEAGFEFEERLPHGKQIKIFMFKDNPYPEGRTAYKRVIPQNEYFLMGDSRDNAMDSRFIGPIKKDQIIGRVIYSYWGSTSERINVDLTLQ